MKKMSIIAACALGVTTVGLTATVGNAAFTTRCVGVGGAVTIPGDLVVPAGESCVLDGTTVTGNVRVQRDADLVVTNGTFEGRVNVAANGYFDATETSIAGAVVARESFGNLLTGSSVGGAVSAINEGGDYYGFLIVEGSDLGAQVRATGASLDLQSSTVATNVVGLGSDYTDVHDTVVEGNVRVESNAYGSVVCDSEVYGNANFTTNSTGVQLGGSAGDGAIADCDGSNYFDGNVNVNGTDGGAWVFANIIRGNLAGTGNDPAPVGEDNRVRGALRGQFADLQGPAALSGLSTSSRTAAQPRVEENLEAAQERLNVAEEEAQEAGQAF